ncbi:glycosyl hydrolase family 88 domain-containing protein [Sarocladium implicatum]|nr:glycosyl hydrolase family 88 domain-containing protein [Sarocladium implicatum]
MRLSQVLSGLCLAASASSLATRGQGKEDESVNIIESTMARFTPSTLGRWEYFVSLYLMGQYVVYKRTGEERYFTYIQDWADRWFDEDGNFTVSIGKLDDMQAGNVMLILWHETGDKKYAQAARVIRDAIDPYPRTSDGGLWHGTSLRGQLWADGTFMVNPFLARWGYLFDDEEYTHEEVVKQIIVYGDHLLAENGLLIHAYDETRKAGWADPKTGLSGWQWCRAMGWYGLAITDILEFLPEDYPGRDNVLDKFQFFMDGVVNYQDSATGRWYEVVDRAEDEDNWTETSCSAMFTYTADIAISRGWLKDNGGRFKRMVKTGRAGVLDQVVKNKNGLTDVVEIVVGTNVGDLAHYYGRPRKVNDLHGLGAVLLMNEQVAHGGHFIIGGEYQREA